MVLIYVHDNCNTHSIINGMKEMEHFWVDDGSLESIFKEWSVFTTLVYNEFSIFFIACIKHDFPVYVLHCLNKNTDNVKNESNCNSSTSII